MVPLPPLAAGTVKSVIAAPAVKVLAVTEPVPKEGAESVPRMMTVTEEGEGSGRGLAVNPSMKESIRPVSDSSGSVALSVLTGTTMFWTYPPTESKLLSS